jgi:DNA-binding beta-propeller fold protein YncE
VPTAPTAANERLFVAVEDEGKIAELDGASGAVLRTMDLVQPMAGMKMKMDVHNVQGDAAGRTVWVTGFESVDTGEPGTDHDHGASGAPRSDELVGIEVATGKITARIPLGEGKHVAHVVLAQATAYVTAFEANQILVVDVNTKQVTKTIALPAGTKPHGERLTPDGRSLVLAGMGAGAFIVVDLASDAVATYPLPGRAIQAAVSPSGDAAFATIYDTRQVARLDLRTREVLLFDLPAGAVGPVQIYPSPDGTHVWVADQGMVDGRPAGNHLYRMKASTGEVDLAATVASGPHGVVVSGDGKRVWTTTVVDGNVQSIDAETGNILFTSHVGANPNGITCVHEGGSMP